ncbi:hypothetical protein Tco_0052732 [Tanacetum coccineum]
MTDYGTRTRQFKSRSQSLRKCFLTVVRTVNNGNELNLLFSSMFDELLNETTPVVSNSSDVHAADDLNKFDDDEFVNVFSTPVQERGETSSRHVDSSNMHTFYQRHPSEHRWTKDHPLEQVIGNPSQSIRTRRQLETDGKCVCLPLTAIEQTTSLLANNADLKALIQEKEVNSRAKIQSHKTKNSNKPVDQKSHTQKHGGQIFTRHRFSPNKTSVVYEKTSPRSDLRWKPTGRIFKSVGLRWISTGKSFDSFTSKVDSEPTHGSNVDIPNIHESKQTLDLSAGTSINVQKEQSLDLSAGTLCNVNKEDLRPRTTMSTKVPTADMIVMMSMIQLESLFGPLFDEYFNGENLVVSKSSAVTTADASNKRQQQPDSNSSTSTLATSVTADGNFDL